MIIKLSPQRRDDTLVVLKNGDTLTVNGEVFDFSPIGEGDTLPASAIESIWFVDGVQRVGGALVLDLLFPNPWNYSPAQAFPAPLLNVPNGRIVFPLPLPDEEGKFPDLPPLVEPVVNGVVDWSQLVTKAMKDAALLAEQLAASQAKLTSLTKQANAQVTALQGRVDTINDAIDGAYALPEEEAELPGRVLQLAAWKKYRVDLGRVKTQSTWPTAPAWPAVPELYAEGMSSVAAPVA